MSPSHAVVWLTAQADVSVNSRDGMTMASLLHSYEAPLNDLKRMRDGELQTLTCDPCKQWWYGSKDEQLVMNIEGQDCTVTFLSEGDDDLMQLTVEISDDDRKLHRFVTWRDRPKKQTYRPYYKLGYIRQWYVYLGHLPPTNIIKITPVKPVKSPH
jgi:hypothetical protein